MYRIPLMYTFVKIHYPVQARAVDFTENYNSMKKCYFSKAELPLLVLSNISCKSPTLALHLPDGVPSICGLPQASLPSPSLLPSGADIDLSTLNLTKGGKQSFHSRGHYSVAHKLPLPSTLYLKPALKAEWSHHIPGGVV